MTTLTLNQSLTLEKTHFEDLVELRNYIDRELETGINIDFKPLMKKEITLALRKKMAATKKLPSSRFVSLTRKHANRTGY